LRSSPTSLCADNAPLVRAGVAPRRASRHLGAAGSKGAAALAHASARPRARIPAVAPAPSPVPNALIGVTILIGAETMFFAGLIAALFILRANSVAWPPPGQPRLPLGATALNSVVLIVSGFTMYRALAAMRAGGGRAMLRLLAMTGLLGATFLMVQGLEWVRLLGYGLRASSNLYGATFYTAIGAHGLHVMGGLAALAVVVRHAVAGRYDAAHHAGLEACAFFWLFVVALWPVLYVLVYLT
jgi:cytochrome c oxidase subunit III